MLGVPDEGVFAGRTNDNIELLKAWAGSTLAYGLFSSRGLTNGMPPLPEFTQNLVIAGIVCGLAFVLHELAHRVVARSYGAQAHFIANNGMLLMSIAIAAAGIFIAAPGAVWHRGRLTTRQGGLIALAGPATNMVLSVLFFVALAVAFIGGILNGLIVPDWLLSLLYVGFSFNAWLGVFNMIPAGPFDGAKVLAWSPLVFGITVAIGIGLAFGLTNQRVLNTLLDIVLQIVRG